MRILGIDYGERRIGLALSDPTATLARPLRTIELPGTPADRAVALAEEIAALPPRRTAWGASSSASPAVSTADPTRRRHASRPSSMNCGGPSTCRSFCRTSA